MTIGIEEIDVLMQVGRHKRSCRVLPPEMLWPYKPGVTTLNSEADIEVEGKVDKFKLFSKLKQIKLNSSERED